MREIRTDFITLKSNLESPMLTFHFSISHYFGDKWRISAESVGRKALAEFHRGLIVLMMIQEVPPDVLGTRVRGSAQPTSCGHGAHSSSKGMLWMERKSLHFVMTEVGDKDDCLLGCCVVYSGRNWPKRRNIPEDIILFVTARVWNLTK
jgi:hypothetical protein